MPEKRAKPQPDLLNLSRICLVICMLRKNKVLLMKMHGEVED